MYKLVSKFPCISSTMIGTFQWVSDAVEYAQKVGMSGEEFDVFNSDGVRVAGTIVENKLEPWVM